MPVSQHYRRNSGYTLIELLCVAVLLALITTLSLPTLVRRVHGDPIAAAAASLRDCEHQIRLTAALDGGAVVTLTSAGLQTHTAGSNTDSDANPPTGACQVESPLSVEWYSVQGQALQNLIIDRYGRSIDAQVVVSDGREVRRYHLAGSSGQWSEAADDTTGHATP